MIRPIAPNFPVRGLLVALPMQEVHTGNNYATGVLPISLTSFGEQTHEFVLPSPPFATLRLVGVQTEIVVGGTFLKPAYTVEYLNVRGKPSALYGDLTRLVRTSGWAGDQLPGDFIWYKAYGHDLCNVIGLRDKSRVDPANFVDARVKVVNARTKPSNTSVPPFVYMLRISGIFDVLRDRYVEGSATADLLRGYYGDDVNPFARTMEFLLQEGRNDARS